MKLAPARCAALIALTTAAFLGFVPHVAAEDLFRERIVPFVKTHCAECHNAKTAEAELNLVKFTTAEEAADDFRSWEHVLTFVERREMPPPDASSTPTDEARADFLRQIRTVLHAESRKRAGDPGVVLPRRLSNAEYDHTIRDLTGVDIRPTRSFPVDPAAGEGFDNTGEALTMSPALFAKLYAAAQHVADHALLTTQGIEFAPFPVATFADRVKFYEQAILQFYETHQVNYETYLTACWEFRYRREAQKNTTIDQWAQSRGLSAKYLRALDETLNADPAVDAYYLGWLRRRWNAVPAPADRAAPELSGAARASIQELARDLTQLSKQICPRETEAIVSNAGNGPVQHLERRRKTAAERDTFHASGLSSSRRLAREFKNLDRAGTLRIMLEVHSTGAEPPAPNAPHGYLVLKSLNLSTAPIDQYKPDDDKRNIPLGKLLAEHAPEQHERLKLGQHPQGSPVDANACVIAVPSKLEIEIPVRALGDTREIRFFVDAQWETPGASARAALVTLGGSVTRADGSATAVPAGPPTLLAAADSPAARDIAESGSAFCRLFPNRFYYVDDTRGLSAGFHLIEGVFRDDQPLCRSVLNDADNRQLDRLWTELEFVTGMTEKMLRGFVFFERSERNFLKHADFDPFKEEDPKLVEIATLERFERVYLDRSNVKAPIAELTTHPIHIFFEQVRQGLELRRRQMQAAEPIYRRNLEQFARTAYRRPLTDAERADHVKFFEQIARQEEYGLEQAVRASLVRILVSPYFGARIDPAPEGNTVRPLGDHALASRLSYFLWSSMPDAELMALADAGKLQDERVLVEQTRRMLKDARVTDFAAEFFGQWLGYRDFPQQESVDRTVFRDFDEALKQAMFEEPTRVTAQLIRSDAPVTRLLDADFTLVNERLARHYGLAWQGRAGEWQQVDGLSASGRSGILGMAVFLTKHAQPQRTSPVKRGFWVVHKVLGEHIPAPPANVVALPAKETDTNGKTIRELLALHVEDAKCARCHVRFDAVGLAMEGFDPIGRRRSKDLAGRPVDDVVRMADGSASRGVPEYARYLAKERRDDFTRTLCRKLLGYALGRSLQLSDEVLLDEMRIALDNNAGRWVPLFEVIVRSPQFRQQRCRDFSVTAFRNSKQGDSR